MFLHEDRQVFNEIITATSEHLGRPLDIVEKDYYVTMILKLLFMNINGPLIANHYGVIRRAGYKVSGKSRSLKEWTPKLIRIPYNPIRTNDLTPKFFLI